MLWRCLGKILGCSCNTPLWFHMALGSRVWVKKCMKTLLSVMTGRFPAIQQSVLLWFRLRRMRSFLKALAAWRSVVALKLGPSTCEFDWHFVVRWKGCFSCEELSLRQWNVFLGFVFYCRPGCFSLTVTSSW